MLTLVNEAKIRAMAPLIRKLVDGMELDYFTDPRFYPPPRESRRMVAAYFLVMVAMDHRLSRPNAPYEGYVDGEFYHGADLLYRLGAKKLEEDPDFFTAERLSRVTTRTIVEWLTVKSNGREVRPPDPDVRAELLRDIGVKLLKLFDGDPYEVVARSGNFLRRGVGEGFIDLLKVFKAYQDPVEKKAFLLAKFLERRDILRIKDPQNKEVPVDNHLVRLAIRWGILVLDYNTVTRIREGHDFAPHEDTAIRLAARTAYKLLASKAGIDVFILDDFLWLFGRRCCVRGRPVCISGCVQPCRSMGWCSEEISGACPLSKVCLGYNKRLYMVNEHKFLDTWWY